MSSITGTESSNTTLVRSADDDTIQGLGGDDIVTTGTGLDLAHGGAGKDTLVVDYSASTGKVVMAAPTDTGVVNAGFPAPGGTTVNGTFPDDLTYTVAYSNIDLSQADHIWFAIGGSALGSDAISGDGKSATFSGTYHFSISGFSIPDINYTLTATLSDGTWIQPDAIGLDDNGAVLHEVQSSGFSVTYVLETDLNGISGAILSSVKDRIQDQIEEAAQGDFLYDDSGVSGKVSDGKGNTATFDDFENFVITTGSAGSVIITGDGSDTLTGGAGADLFRSAGGVDHLSGGGGNDTFYGGAGADVIDGGAGSDTAVYSDQTLAVSVTLAGATHVRVKIGTALDDTLSHVENIVGGKGADHLTGDALANTLSGGSGNDVLIGAGGRDVLDGGAGIDTASYSSSTLAVSVTLNKAANASVKIGAAIEDTIRNIENIIGGKGADHLAGDALANSLSGGLGNDVLIGAGRDVLDGGAGIDTADYSASAVAVTVILNRAVNASVKVGAALEDTIRNIENVTGGKGADHLTGDAIANHLAGGAGNDILRGMASADVLTGGAGRDTLSGGAGRDTFVFLSASDSAGILRDTITDFSRTDRDVLDLSAIDAREATKADNAFHFLTAEGAAFKLAGDLHFVYKGSGATATTWVEGDTDGDRKADFSIVLDGHQHLTQANFDL